jgi:ectoine hydroxylase-related dioxygenase (phytanoyl-CoA dioxygenase family)
MNATEAAEGDAAGTLAQEVKAHFAEDGYIILRRFVEPTVVQDARAALESLVESHAERLRAAGRISDGDMATDAPFETRLYEIYRNRLDEAPTLFRRQLHLPGLFGLFFHARLLDQVEYLLGTEIRLYPNYSARPKLPDHAPTEVLWHQDAGYTAQHPEQGQRSEAGAAGAALRADGLRMVNVWMPLVPATRQNGCMQFIPGTHHLGVVPHVTGAHGYLEIAEEQLAPQRPHAVDIELNPGDLVLFSNLLFHQGQPNRSSSIRWSLDWRYQDARQDTLRPEQGHLARSRAHPERVVATAPQWGGLEFA